MSMNKGQKPAAANQQAAQKPAQPTQPATKPAKK